MVVKTKLVLFIINNLKCLISETRYTVFPYNEIREITNHFNENPKNQGGNLIGKGGFGTVFYGKYNNNNIIVAFA
jgi:hypothetical protein